MQPKTPPRQLIDDDFFARWGNKVFEESEILWEGSPKAGFSIALLEKGTYHDVMTGPSSILGMIGGFILVFAFGFYGSGMAGMMAATIFLGILIILLPDVYRYFQRRATRYAITEKKVLFRIMEWGKVKIYELPFENIGKITYQEYGDKSGILYFLPRKAPGFKTSDFSTGGARFYPTFEMIPEVVEVWKKAEDIRKQRLRHGIQPAGKALPAADRPSPIKAIKIVQNIILIVFSFYILDFYLLPARMTDDRLENLAMVELRTNRRSTEAGGNYRTQTGLTFGTQGYAYPEFRNSVLTITYSPVFKSVKDISINGKSYKKALSSDLNGVTKYFHFVTFLVLLGGRVILSSKKEPLPLTEVVASGCVFLGISFYLWMLFN